jgi:hypothetical protein
LGKNGRIFTGNYGLYRLYRLYQVFTVCKPLNIGPKGFPAAFLQTNCETLRSSQHLEPQNPWCLRFVITFLRSWWGPLAPPKRPVAIIFLIYSNCRQLKCPSCWDRPIQTRLSIRSEINQHSLSWNQILNDFDGY